MRLCLSLFSIWLLVSALPAQSGPVDWDGLRRFVDRGRYQQAERLLEGHLEPEALRWQIELLERRGARQEARELARRLVNRFQSGQLTGASAAAAAAYAAWRLDQWHLSNDIFIEAAELPDASPSMYVDWAYLYLHRYDAAEAEAIFREALEMDRPPAPSDRWRPADIYLGLARALQRQGRPETEEVLEQAAEAEPDHPDRLAFEAELAVRESDWDHAQELLEKGLKVNPNSLPLLRVKAARFFFMNQLKEYEKAKARVLDINAVDGDLFEMLGDLCVIRRRSEEAIQFFRTAFDQNPRQWSALASLGINLLRVGNEEEGKAVLERAYANDPFNLWTVNTLRLLDSLDRFTRFSTPHFEVKIESDEVAALRPYVEQLLERSLETISSKYEHAVTGPIIFEMYSDHEDFAVRTLGMPGLGALGATFGKVVAMDSPSARPGGRFHWGATLWHEVAHVVTLSLSDQKVPRWLTEGISMLEEKLSSPGWGDPLSIPFVQAYAEGKLLSIPELNSGFERPRFPGQLELSYFQAGWVCDFIAQQYGVGKLREMLLGFAEGLTQEEVFKKVLGVSGEQLDQEFQAEMKRVLDPIKERLKPVKAADMPGAELQMAALFGLVTEDPDSYQANLALGSRLVQAARREEAIPYLEKALELFPEATGKGSPYPVLRQIYEELEDRQRLVDLMLKWWNTAPRNAEVGMTLADLLLEQGRREEAIPVLEGLMYVDPLQPRPHQLLGELYLETERPQQAAREYQIALSLDPADAAAVHYGLALALDRQGDRAAARREVLLALEIAPSYAEAQKLLLKLVRQ